MKASYLKLFDSGELEQRAETARRMLSPCVLCPEKCGAMRLSGQKGRCGIAGTAIVSDYSPHFGEERPISGIRGSGTVFFSGCNMHCVFCQNHEISQQVQGTSVTPDILAFIFLMLQETGCHNINLVTPSHIIPMFLQGLLIAAGEGLVIPVVYNSGGYDSVDTLKLLDQVIDIYMPDFKYWDEDNARRLSGIKRYPHTARSAVREMHRQVGRLLFDHEDIAVRGLLIRHLVLPGGLAGTGPMMTFLKEEVSPGTAVNIMNQYHPCSNAAAYPPLDRRITQDEYHEAVQLARSAGMTLCS